MASSTLRRLVDMASFSTLQDKLETWLEDFAINTCDQNVGRCMEIIELNSRLQSQLFRLLSLTSAEGGIYGGASVFKSRLLPWLSTQYVGGGVTDVTLDALSEAAAKDRELNAVQDMYDRSLKDLQTDLSVAKAEVDHLKIELDLKRDELDSERRKANSDKLIAESELTELRAKVRFLEDELELARSRSGRIDSYERQIDRLRDQLAILNSQRDASLLRDVVDGDTELLSSSRTRSLSAILDPPPAQRYRQLKLINRFNDMYASDRLDAMDILRQYSDVGDYENNQRIVFAAIQEAFYVTKLAFSSYKMSIRSTLAATHTGPETLEEAVQSYIDRHRPEIFETADLVDDTVRSLERRSGLYLPPGVTFMVIHSFIRESCRIAWSMLALPRPLDIAPAASLELFDDTKYRRSYDSDLIAPLVTHHIWPCLMQGSRVVMKGEACAIRGGSLAARSRSTSRSASPTRHSRTTSPYRASGVISRTRSPSPRRAAAGLSSSSGERARSPNRKPLSQYGLATA